MSKRAELALADEENQRVYYVPALPARGAPPPILEGGMEAMDDMDGIVRTIRLHRGQ
jgi:hypothetical protein